MKQLILSLLILLLVSVFVGCSKNDVADKDSITLVGNYTIVRTGQVDLITKKFKEDLEKITGEITLFTDNSYRIVFVEDGVSEVFMGVYDAKLMKIDNKYEMYYDGKYLVIITEYNDDYNDVVYFLKK